MLGFAKTEVGGSWLGKNGGGKACFGRTKHPVDASDCKTEGGRAHFGKIRPKGSERGLGRLLGRGAGAEGETRCGPML